MFDVAVVGYGVATVTAPTRGRALADSWRCDAFGHISFGQFLRIASARMRKVPPADDGYGYVRNNYGLSPTIGQRCYLTDNDGKRKKSGTILYPGSSTAHVHVAIDGAAHPSWVHPSEIELVPVPSQYAKGSQP